MNTIRLVAGLWRRETSKRAVPRRFLATTRNRAPAAYYRGGTSRAVFFQLKDLPEDKSRWDAIFLGCLGSPDANGRQLDGMGGGISSLSKVCVIGPSDRSEADVDYTFVAIGVKDTEVDFSSNCGNMTSAVGPFAADSKLIQIDAGSKMKTVRVNNTNTGKIIHVTFPVDSQGDFEPCGEFGIDGVSGTASQVKLDFIEPAGSRTGRLLPTGRKVDIFDGKPATCIDVGNPCCFIQAVDLGVEDGLTPAQIESHPTLLKQLDSIRRQAGVAMGLAKATAEVPGSIPKICLVSPAGNAQSVDLRVRAISVGQPHKAIPITVALSVAAASGLEGTTVNQCVSTERVDPAGITIGHASGKLMVDAKFGQGGVLESASVLRTARRLMEGTIYWK